LALVVVTVWFSSVPLPLKSVIVPPLALPLAPPLGLALP
jgi:hypothetical protein